MPEPTPGPDEVIVDVAASALNRADLLQRRGFYPGRSSSTAGRTFDIPGMELSGTVVERGDRVTECAIGDAVMAIVSGGALRGAVRRARAPAPVGARSPCSTRDAAAIPEVFITAWDALVVQGGLTSGRTALVHAGASGVGTAAIQIVKAIGGAIVVTASTGKVEACRALGADHVVDYTSEDFVAAAIEFTGGRGVDVVLDVIGGDYLERNLDALATQGTIVQVGAMGGGNATFTLGKMLYQAGPPDRHGAAGPPARGEGGDQPAVRARDRAAVRPRPAEAGDRPALLDSTRSSTRTATWSRTRTSARSC